MARIAPKNQSGPDDPRHGLTLCRAHHRAFEAWLFTLTPDYPIVISPLVRRANSRKFELHGSRLDQQRMQIPRREVIAARCGAIEWHVSQVFPG